MDIVGGVTHQVLGVLEVDGTVGDDHRDPLIKRQNCDVLSVQALKSLSVTPGIGRVGGEEGHEGRGDSAAKERNIQQGVPMSRDEMVEE